MPHFPLQPFCCSAWKVPAGCLPHPGQRLKGGVGTGQVSLMGLWGCPLSHSPGAWSSCPQPTPPGSRQQERPSPRGCRDICQPSLASLSSMSPQMDSQTSRPP